MLAAALNETRLQLCVHPRRTKWGDLSLTSTKPKQSYVPFSMSRQHYGQKKKIEYYLRLAWWELQKQSQGDCWKDLLVARKNRSRHRAAWIKLDRRWMFWSSRCGLGSRQDKEYCCSFHRQWENKQRDEGVISAPNWSVLLMLLFRLLPLAVNALHGMQTDGNFWPSIQPRILTIATSFFLKTTFCLKRKAMWRQ